ncbi:MAG: DUF87 domain-containing protein [Candidatus Pacearchaeota archaeon]|jgi:hypothetical protein
MSIKYKKTGVLHLAKKEIKQKNFEKKVVFFLFLITAVSVSILLLFFLAKLSMTGYANYLSSQAGTITNVQITRSFDTTHWTGIYGLALRVSNFTEQLYGDFDNAEITRQDLFFDCIDTSAAGGPEVYASISSTVDFDNLVPASPSDIDSFTGCSGKVECAINTYLENMSVMVGETNITNIPAAYTYKYDGNNDVFDLGILSDGVNLVYVTHVSDIQASYNEEKLVNFQMILPTRENVTETYYFFTDPNDVCPGGGIGNNVEANLSGYTFDENGTALANVSVTVAGYSDLSDENGFFSFLFTVVPGTYNLFATKENYDNLFSNVSVNFTDYVLEENLTLSLQTPGQIDSLIPHVYGYVRDETGSAVSTAKVILGSETAYTDSGGYYSFYPGINVGSHAIVAIKPSYNNYYAMLNFTANTSSVNYNITLNSTLDAYSYPTGPYTDSDDGRYDERPEDIIPQGVDYWISTKEINVEVRKNTFVEKSLSVYNFKSSALQATFSLSSNLKDFVKIDKTSVSVIPDTFSNLGITVYGTADIGQYNGTLTIGGDLDQEIPIQIKVVEKNLPIEVLLMDVELFNTVLHPEDTLQYQLNLQNLLRGQSYNVNFKTRIRDLNSSSIYNLDEFNEEISNSHAILRKVKIPSEVSEGDFVLEVEATYLNLFSVSVAHLLISKPLYLYSFFGLPLWAMFAIISFISFSFLNFFLYKRYKDKKKRYSVAVEFATLPKPGKGVARLGNIAETKHPAYYELERLTTHAIVAGATGMGKSISAQVIIEEALMNNIAVIVFDPTAQWSGMLRKCTDKKMMSYYPKFGLKETDARAFKGNVRQVTHARELIDINKYVSPGQIQIFSLNKLDPKDMDIFVSNVIRQVFKSDPKESPVLKVLLVFDEVHRLLSKFGGSGQGFLQVERACREFRKWGLGMMLISQVLNDFVGEIKANINTEVQTRTLEEGDLERIKTKYGEGFLKSLIRAEVGVAMFQNAEYNRGRPYFINFRPILHNTRRLPDEELEKYNKYNDIVDDLEFSIDALEREKQDVFDLRMELKLVKDKVMSGNFSVVEIYLEGLKPRVEKAWETLGKAPPKREIKLVSEDEIKKSVKEAQESRKEFVETKKSEADPKNFGKTPEIANAEEKANIKKTNEEKEVNAGANPEMNLDNTGKISEEENNKCASSEKKKIVLDPDLMKQAEDAVKKKV